VTIWTPNQTSIGKLTVDRTIFCWKSKSAVFRTPRAWTPAAGVARLPLLHADPFDRLLVAQAISETMRLMTADAQLAAYSELVITIELTAAIRN